LIKLIRIGTKVSFNPNDSSEILLTGNQIFRRYYLNNGRFVLHDQRNESLNINCHCWLNENIILLGINQGFIATVNKHGHIIQKYNV
jgi:hypothetical protein